MTKRLISTNVSSLQQAMGLFFGCCSYFMPIKNVILLMIIMILIGQLSRIWVDYKMQQSITSQNMWKTVPKIVWACLAVMMAFAMEKELQLDWLGLTKVIGGIICGFEFWSILEDAAKITEHPAFNFIKKLMKKKAEGALQQKIEDEKS